MDPEVGPEGQLPGGGGKFARKEGGECREGDKMCNMIGGKGIFMHFQARIAEEFVELCWVFPGRAWLSEIPSRRAPSRTGEVVLNAFLQGRGPRRTAEVIAQVCGACINFRQYNWTARGSGPTRQLVRATPKKKYPVINYETGETF